MCKKKKRKPNIPRIVMAAVILLNLLVVGILALVLVKAKTSLVDQTAALRYGNGERFGQVSAFLSKDQRVDAQTIRQLRDTIEKTYLGKSTVASFKQGDDGLAPNLLDSYSAYSTIQLSTDHGSGTFDAIGIGGDFFYFHPLQLVTGNYFTESDLMHDYILLDREAAEKLYGSADIAGMRVSAGDQDLVIAGVYDRKQGEIDKLAAGGEEPMVFVNYDTLNVISGGGTPTGNSGTGDSSSGSGSGSSGDLGNTSGGGGASDGTLCITCYELIGPNPINHFTFDVLKETKVFSETGVQYLENSNRFSYARYYELLKARKSREMRTDDIALPFWDNVARYREGRLMYVALWQWILAGGLFLAVFVNVLNFLLRHKPTKKKFEEIVDKIQRKTHHIPERL